MLALRRPLLLPPPAAASPDASSSSSTTATGTSSSTYSYYNGNLGALSRTVVTDAPAIEIDPYAGGRVSVESFANRGFAIDGGTAAVNAVLLLVLIALSFERIFGLDKVRVLWGDGVV